MFNPGGVFLLTGLILTAASMASGQSLGPLQAIENDQGLLVTEGDAKVLFYQRKPKSLDGQYERANYVHPLYDLDGNVLTEDFPKDHPHHRGIFWAWHQILLGEKKVGDGWVMRDFSWDVTNVEVSPKGGKSLALKLRVLWKSPLWQDAQGRQKPLVREQTLIRIHKAADGARKIDFEISLLALEKGLRIGGSDNAKGYGGFSPRIRLPDGLQFIGESGTVQPLRTAIKAGPWVDMSARFGKSQSMSGMTILCHNSLPEYPQKWILRRKGSMQNVAYPGRTPVEISTEKPLVLRYRIVLHRGSGNPTKIKKWHAEYCRPPAAKD